MKPTYTLPADVFSALVEEYRDNGQLEFIGLIHTSSDYVVRVETRLVGTEEDIHNKKLTVLCMAYAISRVTNAKGIAVVSEAWMRTAPIHQGSVETHPQTGMLRSDANKTPVRDYEDKKETLLIVSVSCPSPGPDNAVTLTLPVTRDAEGRPIVTPPDPSDPMRLVEIQTGFANFLGALSTGAAGERFDIAVRGMEKRFANLAQLAGDIKPIVIH